MTKTIAQAPRCHVPGCDGYGVAGAGVDLLADPPRWGRWLCLRHSRESAGGHETPSPRLSPREGEAKQGVLL